MPVSRLLGGRYRLEEPIGQGGMGVVYRAVDSGVRNRWVAVKTIKGNVDQAALDQFRKEWDALAGLCHANIIDVYDVGEFSDQEGKKPFFVMPLLRGANLGDLLKSSGTALDSERLVGIISQVCKGLQSAHNRGIIHRDLKPNNIFVLEDDSVKIIDFGVAHLATAETGSNLKGTLHYMSPEQLDGKVTVQSDIFSLGVLCYEALSGRKPFNGNTLPELMDAIRRRHPAPLSEVNSSIPFKVAQVIHRALAKQGYHRISSAKEFADYLQRGLRDDPLPRFDQTKVASRTAQIKKTVSEGDCQYAQELLNDLQAEGHISQEISVLRVQIEQATRSRMIHQLLDAARLRMDEDDFPLAQEKVQSILDVDPTNIDALALKREIKAKRNTAGVDRWYQIACQHRDARLFGKAREAIAEILKVQPNYKGLAELLGQIRRAEQEQTDVREERQHLYESALKAYGSGEISTALNKLERIIELGKRGLGNAQTDGEYEKLYDRIRLERDELQSSYEEARAALQANDPVRALDICKRVLERRPRDPLFKALQIEIDERGRQVHSGQIADVHRRIEGESDLEIKVQLAKEAIDLFPQEQTFNHSLKLIKEKRDLVKTIAGRAREYESQQQLVEARNQWDILRNIYPQFPGLDLELKRLDQKQHQSLQERVESEQADVIARAIALNDLERAGRLLYDGLIDSPYNPELQRLNREYEAKLQAKAAGSQSFAASTREDSSASEGSTKLKAFQASAALSQVEKPRPIDRSSENWPKQENANSFTASGLFTSSKDTRSVAASSRNSQSSYTASYSEPKQELSQEQKLLEPLNFKHRRQVDDRPSSSKLTLIVTSFAIGALLLTFWWARQNKTSNLPANRATTSTVSTPEAPTAIAPPIVPPSDAVQETPQQQPEPKSDATGQRPPGVRADAHLSAVHFRTEPVTASVKADFDDKLHCRTPCTLSLAPGQHTLVFSSANRNPVERTISVPNSGEVLVQLPQASSTVQFISNPPQLKILIDGQERGDTPVKLRLSSGAHALKVVGKGLSHEQSIEVSDQDGGLQIVSINLERSTATSSPKTP